MVEIRAGGFGDFFETPFCIYGKDSPYVSVFRDDLKRFLDAQKNPLLVRFGALEYFVAYRDGRPVGRITAHVHTKSNELHGWSRSYFGYFECADDLEAARALLDTAERWGREHGCAEIWGNMNLTAMQQIGVVTGGFENVPYSDQVWNPPHLPRLLEVCGYAREFPMTSFEVDVPGVDVEKILRPEHRELLTDPSFTWDTLHVKSLVRELVEVCDVLNDGFVENPMFVPLTHEEFQFQAKDLSLIIDERISAVVRQDRQMVGALICIPDLNPMLRETRSRFGLMTPFILLKHKRRRTRAVVIFQSVSKALHRRGLGAVLIYRVMKALQASGYQKLGITWIADANVASLRGAERANALPMHRLHLYRKALA